MASSSDSVEPMAKMFEVGKKATKVSAPTPWVEKYRPKSIDSVVAQEHVTAILKKSVEEGNLPHLLFYGPPGTGKTSSILAMARDMFGAQLIKERVLELNASDERGIDVVREKVKKFAQQSVSHSQKCPPFKLIILDEADSMTKDAQDALRRIIEVYTKMTRFCLICNYVSRIIQPLASRCAKFRFLPLSDNMIYKKVTHICEKENISHTPDMLEALFKVANGDMRRVITLLQICYRYKGQQQITSKDIYEVSGRVPDTVIENVYNACKSNSQSGILKCLENIKLEGYAISSIIDQLHVLIAYDETVADDKKAEILLKLARVDNALSEAADEELQFKDMCFTMMSVMV